MFGLWNECPEDAPVAWGARGIIEYGQVSLLWDRQSWRGSDEEREAFGRKLNAGMIKGALSKAKRLLKECTIVTNEADLVTLYDKKGVKILGNTNGSCGYLYLIAFPTE